MGYASHKIKETDQKEMKYSCRVGSNRPENSFTFFKVGKENQNSNWFYAAVQLTGNGYCYAQLDKFMNCADCCKNNFADNSLCEQSGISIFEVFFITFPPYLQKIKTKSTAAPN